MAEVQGRVTKSCMFTTPHFFERDPQRQRPAEITSFEALRAMVVTGAVVTAPLFEYAYATFGRNVHLTSISGGTDICGGCEYFCQTVSCNLLTPKRKL